MVKLKNNISVDEHSEKPQLVSTNIKSYMPKGCAAYAIAKLTRPSSVGTVNMETVWNIVQDCVLHVIINENGSKQRNLELRKLKG